MPSWYYHKLPTNIVGGCGGGDGSDKNYNWLTDDARWKEERKSAQSDRWPVNGKTTTALHSIYIIHRLGT